MIGYFLLNLKGSVDEDVYYVCSEKKDNSDLVCGVKTSLEIPGIKNRIFVIFSSS